MRKKVFLRTLEQHLYGLPEEDKAAIIEDYEEHFSIGKKHNRTEADIAKSLGDPRKLAVEAKQELLGQKESFKGALHIIFSQTLLFLQQAWKSFAKFVKGESKVAKKGLQDAQKKFNTSMKKSFGSGKKGKGRFFTVLFLLLFNLLIFLPIWVSFLSAVLALMVSMFALTIAGLGSLIGMIFGLTLPFAGPVQSLLLSGLFASIGIICLGIILSIFSIRLVKIFFKGTKAYHRFMKRILFRRKRQ